MKKILIANRGEIACRIIATCREMNIATVAVYSEVDRAALHVAMAHEAVALGPSRASESYLVADKILKAARDTGADAVHPGYGFLSENADFAEAVIATGLTWIGPSPESIRLMGDKGRAREVAVKAGVPVLSGSRRFAKDDVNGLAEAATTIGYPILVKATGGGGGIGMQRVDKPEDLAGRVETVQSMAEKLFGDATVYLERLVEAPRHVEAQIFGFGDGGGVHLFDRDCSIQRRYQKIVEEAPAPGLPAKVRASLHAAALALVREVRYRNLGTIEFLYDPAREEFYFLEMNTRIQVEHPVTEMITGLDLVRWQIEEAAGHGPRPAQADIRSRGHAIEGRLYAERPDRNFMPSPGKISELSFPTAGNLRVDSGLRSGDAMTPFYDPMIAKVIAWGEDRNAALDLLGAALDKTVAEGIHTNRAFLVDVTRDAGFRDLSFSTRYVSQRMS